MTDLRTQRTRREIFTSFNELLKTTPFSKLTVEQIAQTALIHRNTFYLHFTDKYDLLEQFLDTKLQNNQLDPATLSAHPFTTIAHSYAATINAELTKQADDTAFITHSTPVFLRHILAKGSNYDAYQVLGQIAAILLWVRETKQPLTIFRDSAALDRIYAAKRFPEIH